MGYVVLGLRPPILDMKQAHELLETLRLHIVMQSALT
jgi:hypothetical protein